MPSTYSSTAPPMGLINSYYWWHSIDLGNGLVTPGKKSLAKMATEFRAVFGPITLADKRVLDIGAWNGGFSVEAVRRGAAHVTALDHNNWIHTTLKGRETFDLVLRATGLHIDAVDIDLSSPSLSLDALGQFDVVLFLGVLYHLLDPIIVLQALKRITREVLVIETHVERLDEQRPVMVFYPGAELSGDPSNWWGPNRRCVIELLRTLGFRRIDVSPGSYNDREVFHAWLV